MTNEILNATVEMTTLDIKLFAIWGLVCIVVGTAFGWGMSVSFRELMHRLHHHKKDTKKR